MTEISLASAERILRKAGKCRVATGAASVLCEQMQEYGLHVTRRALTFAAHANRKTITKADVKLAIKEL